MVSVGFKGVSKNVRVELAANRLFVALRGTKVLPSVCASARDLAVYIAHWGNIHVHSEIPIAIIRQTITLPTSQ